MKNQKRKKAVLIIDDDQVLCEAFHHSLSSETLDVIAAHTGSEGIRICSKRVIDVVFLDQKLPDVNGIDLCSSIVEQNDQVKIIFITAYPSFDHAVEAIKAGAFDYISKPFEMEELNLAVERSLRAQDLERVEQIQKYRNHREQEEAVIIGRDGGLADIWRSVELASSTNASILITGETGVGKNVLAKTIHYMGPEERSAFVSINCAALSRELIENELFGHEKGAFTGALSVKRGLFEMAEGGTLFLDEIGTLPFDLQSKLLGVLDEKQIRRVGSEVTRPVDVRVIAATNREIETAVSEGSFRSDLYYRLNVIRIHLPPLRDRIEDIPDLCRYFIRQIAPDAHIHFSDSEEDRFLGYHWPGNIRELRNILERAIILREGSSIRPSDLLGGGTAARTRPEPLEPDKTGHVPTLEEVEKLHIQATLKKFRKNYTQTARVLGISRSTLMRKIKTYSMN